MFNFRDTAIFPPKYTNTARTNINNVNKNYFKFYTKEEKLHVHNMASLSRRGPLDRVYALIIYSLAKDVEGGGGDRVLYIVDSTRTSLPYRLLDFPQTCVVFCVESIIVL